MYIINNHRQGFFLKHTHTYIVNNHFKNLVKKLKRIRKPLKVKQDTNGIGRSNDNQELSYIFKGKSSILAGNGRRKEEKGKRK